MYNIFDGNSYAILKISHLSFHIILVKNNFTVPTEHREVTLVEFKTSIDNAISVINKSEH